MRVLVAAVAVLGLLPATAGAQGRIERGRTLYAQRCISCHGDQAQGVAQGDAAPGAGGVEGAGPSLQGVGALAAQFYLSTGYMPIRRPEQEPKHRRPSYSAGEIDALVAYIASFGGPGIPTPRPELGSEAEGFRLFTESCAGCHQVAGRGGLVTGAVAPPLDRATPTQIAAAIRIGPYVMPRFSRRQLSDRQVDSIVRYVQRTDDPVDRGGWSIGHLGAIPEGLVAWLLAGAALVVVARMIGRRAE